jgi:hypothetical protein
MTRIVTVVASAFALALVVSAADAKSAPCRDAHGKFIKCPAPAAAPAGPCRDKTTKKFAKCSAPNTEPVAKSK